MENKHEVNAYGCAWPIILAEQIFDEWIKREDRILGKLLDLRMYNKDKAL